MRIGIGSDFLEYIPDLDTRFAQLKELALMPLTSICATRASLGIRV